MLSEDKFSEVKSYQALGYTAYRASQLSGVSIRTTYVWYTKAKAPISDRIHVKKPAPKRVPIRFPVPVEIANLRDALVSAFLSGDDDLHIKLTLQLKRLMEMKGNNNA